MGANNLIKGVHISFYPEGAKGEKLTSKAFKQECIFEYAYVIEAKKKAIATLTLTRSAPAST